MTFTIIFYVSLHLLLNSPPKQSILSLGLQGCRHRLALFAHCFEFMNEIVLFDMFSGNLDRFLELEN